VVQQPQLVAIDNSRTLITSLLHQMALSSAHKHDKQMTLRHNDAAMLSQSDCSSASSSSQRHTASSADSNVSVSVINDVMNVTSDDDHSSFVKAVVSFIKVSLM